MTCVVSDGMSKFNSVKLSYRPELNWLIDWVIDWSIAFRSWWTVKFPQRGGWRWWRRWRRWRDWRGKWWGCRAGVPSETCRRTWGLCSVVFYCHFSLNTKSHFCHKHDVFLSVYSIGGLWSHIVEFCTLTTIIAASNGFTCHAFSATCWTFCLFFLFFQYFLDCLVLRRWEDVVVGCCEWEMKSYLSPVKQCQGEWTQSKTLSRIFTGWCLAFIIHHWTRDVRRWSMAALWQKPMPVFHNYPCQQ